MAISNSVNDLPGCAHVVGGIGDFVANGSGSVRWISSVALQCSASLRTSSGHHGEAAPRRLARAASMAAARALQVGLVGDILDDVDDAAISSETDAERADDIGRNCPPTRRSVVAFRN
jgi:hypothetical protein